MTYKCNLLQKLYMLHILHRVEGIKIVEWDKIHEVMSIICDGYPLKYIIHNKYDLLIIFWENSYDIIGIKMILQIIKRIQLNNKYQLSKYKLYLIL